MQLGVQSEYKETVWQEFGLVVRRCDAGIAREVAPSSLMINTTLYSKRPSCPRFQKCFEQRKTRAVTPSCCLHENWRPLFLKYRCCAFVRLVSSVRSGCR